MSESTDNPTIETPQTTIIGNAAYLAANFEQVENGWIGYKIFNSVYHPPAAWKIEAGSTITEPNIDTDASDDCSRGINLAISVEWIQNFISDLSSDEDGNDTAEVWKVLIPDTAIIVIPHNTTGKIRVSELQLLEVVATVKYNDVWDAYEYEEYEEYEDDEDEEDFEEGYDDF